MDGITVMRRPESVSWEAVSRVLKEAHRENVRRGIRMTYPQLPPEQLYEKTEGRGGVLFVALDGERLVGTAAVVRIDKAIWCGTGAMPIASWMLSCRPMPEKAYSAAWLTRSSNGPAKRGSTVCCSTRTNGTGTCCAFAEKAAGAQWIIVSTTDTVP